MSAVDENIVREFFEAHGFLVCQRRKYVVQARKTTADEEINLIVLNPRHSTHLSERPFEITASILEQVPRAIVAVKGWHTELFVPSVLEHQPRIFRFVEKRALEEAQRILGGLPVIKILVVPGLPRQQKHRARSIELLRMRGVDGVISFAEILRELIASVETNRNYVKSDVLQILRLLKHYDLLQNPQMELSLRAKGRNKKL